jgi:hypothetical protein
VKRERLRILCALALASGGCDGWDGRPVSYQLNVDVHPPARVRLFADGQEIGTFENGSTQLLQRKERGVRISRRPNAITAQLLTPDGWRPASEVMVDALAPDWEESEIKAGRPVKLGVTVYPAEDDDRTRLHLVVDNRQGPATRVSVGAQIVEVPPDVAWSGDISSPRTPEGARVRLDDRELGRLPLRDDLEKRRAGSNKDYIHQPWWLLDVSGRKTYSMRLVLYGPQGSFQPPSVPAKEVLAPATLHDLGFLRAVSVFTSAPPYLSSSSSYNSAYELKDEP